jgi:hypothetical protein
MIKRTTTSTTSTTTTTTRLNRTWKDRAKRVMRASIADEKRFVDSCTAVHVQPPLVLQRHAYSTCRYGGMEVPDSMPEGVHRQHEAVHARWLRPWSWPCKVQSVFAGNKKLEVLTLPTSLKKGAVLLRALPESVSWRLRLPTCRPCTTKPPLWVLTGFVFPAVYARVYASFLPALVGESTDGFPRSARGS